MNAMKHVEGGGIFVFVFLEVGPFSYILKAAPSCKVGIHMEFDTTWETPRDRVTFFASEDNPFHLIDRALLKRRNSVVKPTTNEQGPNVSEEQKTLLKSVLIAQCSATGWQHSYCIVNHDPSSCHNSHRPSHAKRVSSPSLFPRTGIPWGWVSGGPAVRHGGMWGNRGLVSSVSCRSVTRQKPTAMDIRGTVRHRRK